MGDMTPKTRSRVATVLSTLRSVAPQAKPRRANTKRTAAAKPEYYHGTMYYVPDLDTAFDYYPADSYSKEEVAALASKMTPDPFIDEAKGWFMRVDAEWRGPFDSQADARNAVEEQYKVDPDTGADLDDSDLPELRWNGGRRFSRAAKAKRLADAMKLEDLMWGGNEPLSKDEYKSMMRRDVADSEYSAYVKKFNEGKKKSAHVRMTASLYEDDAANIDTVSDAHEYVADKRASGVGTTSIMQSFKTLSTAFAEWARTASGTDRRKLLAIARVFSDAYAEEKAAKLDKADASMKQRTSARTTKKTAGSEYDLRAVLQMIDTLRDDTDTRNTANRAYTALTAARKEFPEHTAALDKLARIASQASDSAASPKGLHRASGLLVDVRNGLQQLLHRIQTATQVASAQTTADKDLSRWGAKAFLTAWEVEPDDATERSRFVAHTVGVQAARLGMTPEDVTKWLQSAYSNIFVKGNRLDPGMDLKEVRAEILKALTKAQSRQTAEASVHKTSAKSVIVPMGRLSDFDKDPKRDRMAYRSRPMGFDAEVRVFPSRAAMIDMLKKQKDMGISGRNALWNALQKDIVEPNMLVSRLYQRTARTQRSAASDWDNIVHEFAHAVWVNAYLQAVDESTGEANGGTPSENVDVILERAPWSGQGGPGSPGLETYAPDMPASFVAAVEKTITAAWGKEDILDDYRAFHETSDEDAKTYGWYLAMQDMGHGVGLGDYHHDTILKSYASGAEHVLGMLTWGGTDDDVKIKFDVTYGNHNETVDVTDELGDYLADADED